MAVLFDGHCRSRRGGFSFATAAAFSAAAGAALPHFTAAVVGDMGVNNSAATLAMIAQRSYNFTVHVGDVGYADDYESLLEPEPSSGNSYEAIYDLFQTQIEPLAAGAPYMVTPGNHDVTCHCTGLQRGQRGNVRIDTKNIGPKIYKLFLY